MRRSRSRHVHSSLLALAVPALLAPAAGAQVHRRAPDLYVVAMSYEPHRALQCSDARGAPVGRSEVAVSPDGSIIASATPREICLFDVLSGRRFRTLAIPSIEYTEGVEQGGNWALTLSPDGMTLAVFTDRFKEHGERSILLWDTELEFVRQRLILGKGMRDWVDAIDFSGDGSRLASAGTDERVRVWDAESGRVLRIWSTPTPQRSVAISPDGRFAAAGGDDALIRVWDVGSGELLDTFEGHEGRINALTFSPDGRLLASSAADGTIKLWEARRRQYVRTMDGMAQSLAFSPDGKILASGAGSLRLWDAEYGEIARTLIVDSTEPDAFRCARVAYSADGRTLACSDDQGVVRVWRTPLLLLPDATGHAATVGATRDTTSSATSPAPRTSP